MQLQRSRARADGCRPSAIVHVQLLSLDRRYVTLDASGHLADASHECCASNGYAACEVFARVVPCQQLSAGSRVVSRARALHGEDLAVANEWDWNALPGHPDRRLAREDAPARVIATLGAQWHVHERPERGARAEPEPGTAYGVRVRFRSNC